MNWSDPSTARETFEWASQLPWLLLALFALPLIGVAVRGRVYPTVWWLGLLGISLVLALGSVFVPELLTALIIFDGIVVLATAADCVLLWALTRTGITASRTHPATVSLGQHFTSEVTVFNRTALTLTGSVRDDLPEHFVATPEEHHLLLPPQGEITMRRELRPHRRGAFSLDTVYLKISSPLRFWNRHLLLPVESRLKVFPDMKQMSDYALLARTNRLSLIGVRRTRRIGQDSDFERLRDYARDDNYRHIDWRSTAKRNKLTVRQFQTDQSQRVIFLLDCGRMMTGESEGISLFDHSLNAALMMAYVALIQGDSVGMLCFSDTIHTFIPPRGGSSQMNRLIQAGYDQFPRLVESRYDSAFLYLSTHCKRRSLVVLTTNVIDEVNAAAVVDYLGNLTGRHLPLGVLLRDREMFEAADHPEGGNFEMYRAAAAADVLLWRDQVLRDLQHRGVLVVDTYPDELTAPLVNRYLDIKAKHLL